MAEVVLKISGDNSDAMKSLSQVGDKQQEVSDSAKKSADTYKNGTKKIIDANKGVTTSIQAMNSSILQTATNILSIGAAVSAIKSLGTNILNTRAEFQKFEAVLTNTLGSNSQAQVALKNIQEFASKTPFSVKELTANFVKLVNTGFKPTNSELTKLGDLAASQGKSFDQLTEAVIDAQTGEFERLKEFGIRASKEGDKVTFTFKGVKQQVDFTNESIRNYILSLGDATGVSGSMAAISDTLGGKLSNLDDNFDALFNNIGESAEGAFGVVIDQLNEVLGTANQAASKINEIRRNLKSEGVETGFFESFLGGPELVLNFQLQIDKIKELAAQSRDYASSIRLLQAQQAGVNDSFRKGTIGEQTFFAQSAILRKGIKDLTQSTKEYTSELQGQGKEKDNDTVATKEQIKANEDLIKALEDLRKKSKEAQNASLTGSEKINADLQVALDAIKKFEEKLIDTGKKARGEGFKLEQEQIDQLNTLRVQVQKEANDKLLVLQRDFYEKAKKDQEDAEKSAEDFANEQVDKNQKSLEEANKARTLLTKEGTKERLDAEIEAIEKERDFKLDNYEQTADQQIIIEQEALQKIADLQKEFADKQPSSLAKLLGVTDEELQKIKDGLQIAGDQLKDFLDNQLSERNRLLDEELKLNDESKKAQEDKISDLQAQLEDELELQKKGLANNVDAIRQQIADENAAKQAQLENEKRIKEEKKKLALAQLAIDSATQVSDLITASTEIFKGFSAIPIVGVPLAITTIGLMIAAFVSAKAKAVQAIQQGFKEGGYTGDYGADQEVGIVHGKEFVSTAKTTQKHRPLLEAMHNEDYSRLTIKDLMPILEGTGVTFNHEVLTEIKNDQSAYNSRMSNGPDELLYAMKATNKNINRFFEHYKNKPQREILPDGTIKERRNGKTRIIKKK